MKKKTTEGDDFMKKSSVIATVTLLTLLPLTAYAAGAETNSMLSQGTGIGGLFDFEFSRLMKGLVNALHYVLIVMTGVAGMMWAWGIEDGKKLTWQLIFGLGLAANFGSYMMDAEFWQMASTVAPPPSSTAQFDPGIGTKADEWNLLGNFMNYYLHNIINPGMARILPICIKMLVILTTVQAMWDLSFQLISGDKIQYILSLTLKTGLWLFIMNEWSTFLNALSQGFEMIGLMAGNAAGIELKPDSIMHNVFEIFTHINGLVSSLSFVSQTGSFFTALIVEILVIVCLTLMAFELFMAKVEFYTIGLIGMPLLSFALTPKFSFLTDKIIGAMFNLALKIALLSFVCVMTIPLLDSAIKGYIEANPQETLLGNVEVIPSLLQLGFTCLMLFIITTKCPSLVTSLLNGQPQLGGQTMTGMAKGAAVAAVSTAAAAKTGGLSAVAKHAAMSTSLGQAVSRGMGAVNAFKNPNPSQSKDDKDSSSSGKSSSGSTNGGGGGSTGSNNSGGNSGGNTGSGNKTSENKYANSTTLKGKSPKEHFRNAVKEVDAKEAEKQKNKQ